MKRLILAALAISLCGSISAGGIWDKIKEAGRDVGELERDTQKTRKKVRKTIDAGRKRRKAAQGLSDYDEYYLGRAVSAQILSRHRPHRSKMVQGYVQAVGQVVARVSAKPDIPTGYHFMVLDTPEINAMAAPGGFIFVTKGLLRLVRSEDELACVLGHEIGHVVARHGAAAVEKARKSQARLEFWGTVGETWDVNELKEATEFFDSEVGKLTRRVLANGYSKKQESESDHLGAIMARDAGYDPQALEDVLGRIKKGRGGWLKNKHASPRARVRKLEEHALAPYEGHQPPSVRAKRFRRAFRDL